MVAVVLHSFGGYTLKTIMDVPFCHFVKLFSLAEKVQKIDAIVHLNGRAALQSKDIMNDLKATEQSKYKHKKAYKSIATDEAKREAELYAQKQFKVQ